jgi:hypothetical protein
MANNRNGSSFMGFLGAVLMFIVFVIVVALIIMLISLPSGAQTVVTSKENGYFIMKYYHGQHQINDIFNDSVKIGEEIPDLRVKQMFLGYLMEADKMASDYDKHRYQEIVNLYDSAQIMFDMEGANIAGLSKSQYKFLLSGAYADLAWAHYMFYRWEGGTSYHLEQSKNFAEKSLMRDSTNYRVWTLLAKYYDQKIEWDNIAGIRRGLNSSTINPLAKEELFQKKEELVKNFRNLGEAIGRAEMFNRDWTEKNLTEVKINYQHFVGYVNSL